MIQRIKTAIFSFSGLSIFLGVLGFMAGLVQLFVDVNSTISVKWLLLVLLVGFSISMILLKAIFDRPEIVEPAPAFEVPIRYIEKGEILVIRKNEHFLNQILVGCYILSDEVERLACLGVVNHVQDKVIQVRVVRNFLAEDSPHEALADIKSLILRPVVPFSALERIVSGRE